MRGIKLDIRGSQADQFTHFIVQDIDDVRREIDRKLEPLGKKVYAIVNYDNFVIAPDLVDAWTEMVKTVVERYYWTYNDYGHRKQDPKEVALGLQVGPKSVKGV